MRPMVCYLEPGPQFSTLQSNYVLSFAIFCSIIYNRIMNTYIVVTFKLLLIRQEDTMELWDIYDECFVKTGRIHERGKPLAKEIII